MGPSQAHLETWSEVQKTDPRPRKCPAQRHAPPPRRLTLISAGVILRLVGRCLTVAALESASAMSGLSVGSAAAARTSSSFSAQPRRRCLSRQDPEPTTALQPHCCVYPVLPRPLGPSSESSVPRYTSPSHTRMQTPLQPASASSGRLHGTPRTRPGKA